MSQPPAFINPSTPAKRTSPTRSHQACQTTPRNPKTLGRIPELHPTLNTNVEASSPQLRRSTRTKSPTKRFEQSPIRRGRSPPKPLSEVSLDRPITESASEPSVDRETSPSKQTTRQDLSTFNPPVEFKTLEEATSTHGVPQAVLLFKNYVKESLRGKGIISAGLKVRSLN